MLDHYWLHVLDRHYVNASSTASETLEGASPIAGLKVHKDLSRIVSTRESALSNVLVSEPLSSPKTAVTSEPKDEMPNQQ